MTYGITSSLGSNAAGRLASELRLARKHYSALFQPVANHVSLISEINPRRESATESRLQLVASANMNKRGAASRFCDGRSVSAKVVREIDKRLIDTEQRLGRSPFGVNHVVAFELDVEEFQFVALGLIAGDGRSVDQRLRWDQHAVDQQAMGRRHVEIGMRKVWRESGAGDPNRQCGLYPGLRRVALPERIASDPLDRTLSGEDC